jgi:hypothetical protein
LVHKESGDNSLTFHGDIHRMAQPLLSFTHIGVDLS